MGHEFESGMFYRKPAWHGMGTVVQERPESIEEVRTLAGLDWEPQTEPVYRLVGLDESGQPTYTEIDGYVQKTRSDTGATLAVTSDTLATISNAESFEILATVAGETNVKWETAGVLRGGRSIFAVLCLDEPVKIPGDPSVHLPYMAFTNWHDGSGAMTVRATGIRIVCANTVRAAEMEGERSGTTYSFRHTKNWRDKVEDARAAVNGTRREMAEYVALATQLLGHKVTPVQRELFVTEFIPMPAAQIVSDRVVRNIETARGALRAILASPTTVEINGTMWGLVAGAVEYLDHTRTARTPDTRLGRSMLKPEPMKARALKLAREVVKS